MTLKDVYRQQARISVLETLVLEMLAVQPHASAIADALEASLDTDHALQTANGLPGELLEAVRFERAQLLQRVRDLLRPAP
jgi:hypothetical protein